MGRAKSECNLTDYDNVINDNEQYRSTDDNSRNNASVTSSSVGNSYGLSNISTGRDNQFLNAAKRWASYDKTPYISPFARDSWKRTHRKFNYSRFLIIPGKHLFELSIYIKTLAIKNSSSSFIDVQGKTLNKSNCDTRRCY